MKADAGAAPRSMDVVLPDDIVQALVLELEAPAPDASLVARVRERVAARERGAPAYLNIAARDGWEPFAPGIDWKVLFDDGASVSFLVRLAPGVELPSHEHVGGPEECLVLEGDLWLDDQHLAAGDYQLAREGTTHATIRSDGGCLLFGRASSAFVRSVAVA